MIIINNKWKNAALPAVLLHGSIGSVYAWSLFVKPIATYINATTTQVQFAFSLAIFFLGMSAAFGGAFVEKNIKKSSILSMLCFCGGLLLTAFALYIKNLYIIYLGYGCLMGIGLGIGYITPVKTLMLWFSDNKGLATGISVCAFGFASTIASPIITYLSSTFDLPTTFVLLSALYSLPMTIAHFLLYKPQYWDEEQIKSDFNLKDLLCDKKFISIWFIIYINIMSGLAVISTASSILNEVGYELSFIAIIVSIMGVFNGAGRLIFSTISDKLKDRTEIYVTIFVLSVIACFIGCYFNHLSFISLIIISACYGAGFSCLPSLLSDIYGMKNISKIHGISLTAWAIAGLTGNQLAELIYSDTGSYLTIFGVISLFYALALIITHFINSKSTL